MYIYTGYPPWPLPTLLRIIKLILLDIWHNKGTIYFYNNVNLIKQICIRSKYLVSINVFYVDN